MNDPAYPDYKGNESTIYNFYVEGEATPTASVWESDGYIAFYDWVYEVAGSSLWDATNKITWEEFMAQIVITQSIIETPVVNVAVPDIDTEDDVTGMSVASIRAAAYAWMLEYAIDEFQDAEKVQRILDFLAQEAQPATTIEDI